MRIKNKILPLHPQFIIQKGKPEFAILPYSEYEAILEKLEDELDLSILRATRAREADLPTIPIEVVKKKLGLK